MTSAVVAYMTGRVRSLVDERRERTRFYRYELRALEDELHRLRSIIAAVKADRLDEAKTVKPLTLEQSRRRALRDADRRRQVADIQASSSRRIAAIRSKMGRG